MAEIGERQNVWEKKLSAQHVCLQTSSLILGPGRGLVHVCVDSSGLCACLATCFDCVCVRACVSVRVSDLWLEPSLRCLISDRLD